MRFAPAFAVCSLIAIIAATLAIAKPFVSVDKRGARTEHFTIDSRYARHKLGVSVVVPAGAGDGRALLVFLHGRGGDENSEMRNEPMFQKVAELGERAPILAFPDGSDAGYWHDRASAKWSSYVMREVIPEVQRRFKTSTRHVAIGGISMGGYGAYELAREHPGHFCAVGGHSPAIWRTAGETAPGAFDNAEDFAKHDIVGAAKSKPGRFVGPRLWLDAGTGDPFRPGDKAFVAALRAARVPIRTHLSWPGGHDNTYWQGHWPAYLAFYSNALAHCG